MSSLWVLSPFLCIKRLRHADMLTCLLLWHQGIRAVTGPPGCLLIVKVPVRLLIENYFQSSSGLEE